jgi:hypothetical protein
MTGQGASGARGGITSGGIGSSTAGGGTRSGDPFGPGGTAGAGTGGAGTGGIRNECAALTLDGEPMPIDMYLMFDQSSSMGDPLAGSSPPSSWWQAAQKGVTSFVKDPRADGSRPGYAPMSVGIQFFPLDGQEPQSCMADYQTPEVELGLLPGNAGAVAAAVQKHQPTSFTPTAAALNGAIAHMKEWARAHPYHAPVVVLVTDGFPTECEPRDLTDIAQIAKSALTVEPKVRTAVVGFNLPGGENLNEIAAAGGTNKAFLINGGDVASQFVDAMLNISFPSEVCTFSVPTPPQGQVLDVSQVVVTYTSSATMVEVPVPRLNGLGDCGLNMDEGWFYDSPMTPTQIDLCPGTCANVPRGSLRVSTGCVTSSIGR